MRLLGEKKSDKKVGCGGCGRVITVVLNVVMHCEGCSKKVKRTISVLEGVETVTTDILIGKVTVVGDVDPWEVQELLESKTKKKVVLVSPTNFPKKPPKPKEVPKPKEEKKPKPPKVVEKPKPKVFSTIVLKVKFHCEGCRQKIHKTISKVEGVEEVTLDPMQEQVTVKGTMDVEALLPYLNQRLRRTVELVPTVRKFDIIIDKQKEERERLQKEKALQMEKEKQQKAKEKEKEKEKEKNGGGAAEEKKKINTIPMMLELGPKIGGNVLPKITESFSRIECEPLSKIEFNDGENNYLCYGNQKYPMELVHAPQFFSDENPNSCMIM